LKIVALAVLSWLLFASAANAQRWERIPSATGTFPTYIDSQRREGTARSGTLWVAFDSNTKPGVRSTAFQMRFECDSRDFRLIGGEDYSQPGASGDLLRSGPADQWTTGHRSLFAMYAANDALNFLCLRGTTAPTPAARVWKVAFFNDAGAVYWDEGSVELAGERVIIWFLFNFPLAPAAGGKLPAHASVANRDVVHCAGNRRGALEQVFYSEPVGKGAIVQTWKTTMEKLDMRIPPNSPSANLAAQLLSWGCQIHQLKTRR
jgi:hypothetical protein